MATTDRFVTPEAVVLEAELAGLGSRFIAALVDVAVQLSLIVATAVIVVAGGLSGDTATVVWILANVLAWFVYPTALEAASGGKTLGKMVARVRVVRADARPLTFAAVLVRNVFRLVDFLPGFYAVGAISIVVTRRNQRLGDLAAGTVLVYDAPRPSPKELVLAEDEARRRAQRRLDVAALTAEEYGVVRSFLLRRDSLDPGARRDLAADLRSRLGHRVGSDGDDVPAETFLEAVAAAYRERFAP